MREQTKEEKIRNQTVEKKEIPWDFWNHNIHPILGFVWQQPAINSHKQLNKNELDSY